MISLRFITELSYKGHLRVAYKVESLQVDDQRVVRDQKEIKLMIFNNSVRFWMSMSCLQMWLFDHATIRTASLHMTSGDLSVEYIFDAIFPTVYTRAYQPTENG